MATERGRRKQRSTLIGAVSAKGFAEQGGAGDGEQRPLVPRSRYSPRLTPGVRCHTHR
jgi:hypothetical protein